MKQPRLLADESCDFRIVRALRNDDVDVVAVAERTSRWVDEEIMAQAANEDRVLLTEDNERPVTAMYRERRRRPRANVKGSMAKQTAIKLYVQVGHDHTVKLPDDVPVGPAEVIVLVDEHAVRVQGEKSLLGLFADEPDIVDEAMRHVRTLRQQWHLRPMT